LVVFGLEPTKDREIFEAFKKYLIDGGWVTPDTQELLDAAVDWRMDDGGSIAALSQQIEQLVARVEELFGSLDANLKFRAQPIAQPADSNVDDAAEQSYVVDLRGVACPLNFVRAKIELEKIPLGGTLEVLLDAGEPVRNVPAGFAQQGQEVLEVESRGDHFCLRVRHRK